MGCNGRNGYVTVNSSAPGLNVKKNPYCCSVVTVNRGQNGALCPVVSSEKFFCDLANRQTRPEQPY